MFVKTTNDSRKISFGDLGDLKSKECIHDEEVICSNILHKTIHSSDSICDYGEDITIKRGILNWCDEYELTEERNQLESRNAWEDASNKNNKPEISLMVESRKPVYHTNEAFMEYFPALLECLASSSNKHAPMDHEPPLWDTDVSVVLSNESIDPHNLDKDAKSVDSNNSHVIDTNTSTPNS